jgi:hypothetical protein
MLYHSPFAVMGSVKTQTQFCSKPNCLNGAVLDYCSGHCNDLTTTISEGHTDYIERGSVLGDGHSAWTQ